jgi:hypothetical protein
MTGQVVSGDTAAPIYDALARHQQRPEGWEYSALFSELHRWAEIFNTEFKLEIPEWSLCVERLRRTRLGQFRYGTNGLGLRGEITFNAIYLATREGWEVLGTLLHELLHGWQQAHGMPGKRNYHNKEFRDNARTFGLIIDEHGITQYENESAFTRLLAQHGVYVPDLPRVTLATRQAGSSKLKKHSCGCTNIWVGTSRFAGTCRLCGNEFVRVDA